MDSTSAIEGRRERIRRLWPVMTDDEREAVLAVVDEEERDRLAHPLAYARLWHADGVDETGRVRTSQLEAVRAFLAAYRDRRERTLEFVVTFLLGGNRSGKSEARAQIGVAFTLGGDHPDVIRWCRRNGLPLDAIPPGPGLTYNGALDSDDSRNYVRPKDARYFPAGTQRFNWRGQGQAEAVFANGGRRIYKTVDQHRDGWQGDAARLVDFDEEPGDLEVVHEASMRLVDHDGPMLFAMTPLSGWTPLLKQYAKRPRPGVIVRELHGEDNPFVKRDVLLSRLSGLSSEQQAARRYGRIVALEGRVWSGFERRLHVIEPFVPPAGWPRYEAIDFGAAHPTAWGFAAYDEARDELHLYDLHFSGDLTTSQHAEAVKARGYGEPYLRWADPESLQERINLARDHGMASVPALKAVESGINAVAERLLVRAQTGRPRIFFHAVPQMAPLLEQIEGYVRDPKTGRPRKVADDACDMLRYLCMGIDMTYGLVRGPLTTDDEDEQLRAAAK